MVTDRKAFESMVEKKAKDKAYPYHTKKRTVVFGGHRTFLRELRKMLPGLKYVNISNYGFNVEPGHAWGGWGYSYDFVNYLYFVRCIKN